MDTKSISYLKEKLWYRLLKVIYIFSFIYCIGLSIIFAIDEFNSDYITISLFAFILFPSLIYIGFEIIRRAFYYIAIGTIQPSDDNYFIKLKKYKFIIIGIVIIYIIIFSYGVWDVNRIDQQKIKMRNSNELPELPKLPTPLTIPPRK